MNEVAYPGFHLTTTCAVLPFQGGYIIGGLYGIRTRDLYRDRVAH